MENDPVAVLLEDLRDQFKVFGEALDGTRQELNAKIDNLASDVGKMDNRLMRVEADVSGLKSHVASLDRRVHGLDKRVHGLDKRVHGLDRRMHGLDKRMHGVEDHLGLNGVAPKKTPRPSTAKPRKK